MNSNNFREIITAIKESVKEIIKKGAPIADVLTNTPITSVAISVLDIKDQLTKARIERNAKSFVKHLNCDDDISLMNLLNKIHSNKEQSERFSECLLDILMNSPRPLKAKIMANLTTALANKNIDSKQFDRLCLMLLFSSILSLEALVSYFEENNGNRSWKGSLMSSHPMEPMLNSLGVIKRGGSIVTISEEGTMLYQYGLQGFVKENSELEPEYDMQGRALKNATISGGSFDDPGETF
jgi:hypothetical protein